MTALAERAARPHTASEMLAWIADYLDTADRYVELREAERGNAKTMGDNVQNDLRMMAVWLAAHPRVDRRIVRTLSDQTAL